MTVDRRAAKASFPSGGGGVTKTMTVLHRKILELDFSFKNCRVKCNSLIIVWPQHPLDFEN